MRQEAFIPESGETGAEYRYAPSWTLSYADMMSLLLCFFVFLFSIAEVRETKLKAALGSLRAHLGLSPANASVLKVHTASTYTKRVRPGAYREGLPGDNIEVTTVREGEKITVGGRALFDEGTASIRPESRWILAQAADLIRGHMNRVEIRGHCSPTEVGAGSPYEDAEELSWRRAREVARFLVKEAGIDLFRIRVTGCGYVEPAAPNLFAEEASRNRRVEIIVSEDYVQERSEPAAGANR